MAHRTLTLSALVALTQAKAIVSNNCAYDVYVWSIPKVGSSHTDSVPIKPGGRYEEAWRYGTDVNPGVAIKISSQADGISNGGDEVNFAYSVQQSDMSHVWVDLSTVSGDAFDNNLTFHTCKGVYQLPDVVPTYCAATDDVEVALCDTVRTTSAKDTTSLDKIQECYDYHLVSQTSTSDSPKCTCGSPTCICNNGAHQVQNIRSHPQESTSQEDSPCAKIPVPNHCLARVVYPGRRSALLRDGDSNSAPVIPQSTVPLSTVMRHETSKHENAKKTTPLCDLARKHGIAKCNEEIEKKRAHEIYPHLCEPAFWSPLYDCNEVKAE
jgi:hypothetical protein